MKKISIGIPCYNEAKNIAGMYEAVTRQMETMNQYEYEIIFGDNCSNDGSELILRKIAAEDSHVKVIFNAANFGPARNGFNLLSAYTGDAYINIPCDFQEPPEMIPEFIKYWEQGYQVVWGHKIESKENFIKYKLRALFYDIIRFFSEKPQLKQETGFGLVDRTEYDLMLPCLLKNKNMSIRFLVLEYGFKLKLIDYQQHKRKYGKSSYGISGYFEYALNALCNTSTAPLRMMAGFGFIGAFISAVIGIIYLLLKLFNWYWFNAGIGPVIMIVAFAASLQLLCVGVLGQYVAIIMERVTDMPLVVERERIGFDRDENKLHPSA